MKKSKNLIGIGVLLMIFGGMGLDGAEDTIAKIIVLIGIIFTGIGLKLLKPYLMVLAFSVFMMFPAMEVSAQSEQILSDEIIGYCDEIGEQYGICPEMLMAIAERESTGNPLAVNGGCIGLLQISERWHLDRMERLGVDDLFDPYSNILVGADYLMELAEKHGDVALVLDIYNGNSKAFYNNENGIISGYAKGILERSEELEREHGK